MSKVGTTDTPPFASPFSPEKLVASIAPWAPDKDRGQSMVHLYLAGPAQKVAGGYLDALRAAREQTTDIVLPSFVRLPDGKPNVQSRAVLQSADGAYWVAPVAPSPFEWDVSNVMGDAMDFDSVEGAQTEQYIQHVRRLWDMPAWGGMARSTAVRAIVGRSNVIDMRNGAGHDLVAARELPASARPKSADDWRFARVGDAVLRKEYFDSGKIVDDPQAIVLDGATRTVTGSWDAAVAAARELAGSEHVAAVLRGPAKDSWIIGGLSQASGVLRSLQPDRPDTPFKEQLLSSRRTVDELQALVGARDLIDFRARRTVRLGA